MHRGTVLATLGTTSTRGVGNIRFVRQRQRRALKPSRNARHTGRRCRIIFVTLGTTGVGVGTTIVKLRATRKTLGTTGAGGETTLATLGIKRFEVRGNRRGARHNGHGIWDNTPRAFFIRGTYGARDKAQGGQVAVHRNDGRCLDGFDR